MFLRLNTMNYNTFITKFGDDTLAEIGLDIKYDTNRLTMFNTLVYILETYYRANTNGPENTRLLVESMVDKLTTQLGYCNISFDYKPFNPSYDCMCEPEAIIFENND